MNVAKLGKPYHNSCVHNHTHCCFIFQSALLDLFLTTNWMTHLITTSEKTHCAATKYLVELKMKVQFVGFLGGGLAFFFFFFFALYISTNSHGQNQHMQGFSWLHLTVNRGGAARLSLLPVCLSGQFLPAIFLSFSFNQFVLIEDPGNEHFFNDISTKSAFSLLCS